MNTTKAKQTGEGNAPRVNYHDKLRFAESHISAQRTQIQELQTDLERCKDYAGTMTAQRDELLAAFQKIERRTRGADGTNQHPSGALRSIGAMAREAISKAEQL